MKSKIPYFFLLVGLLSISPLAKADGKGGGVTTEPKAENEVPVKRSRTLEGLVLNLKSDKQHYSIGEKVELSSILENEGKIEEFMWIASNPSILSNYAIEIFFVEKKALELTSKGKDHLMNDRTFYSRSLQALKPGDKVENNYSFLAESFDLSIPGVYQISIFKSFLKSKDNKEWERLQSNIVEITIDKTAPAAKDENKAPESPKATPEK